VGHVAVELEDFSNIFSKINVVVDDEHPARHPSSHCSNRQDFDR
jgi:hypothetical protein